MVVSDRNIAQFTRGSQMMCYLLAYHRARQRYHRILTCPFSFAVTIPRAYLRVCNCRSVVELFMHHYYDMGALQLGGKSSPPCFSVWLRNKSKETGVQVF